MSALVMPGDQLLARTMTFDGDSDVWAETPSGLIVPTYAAPEPKPAKPIGVGLFVGAGGMDLGLTMAGFHIAAASEMDLWASATYLCNLGGPDTAIVLLDDLVVRRSGKKKNNPDSIDGFVPAKYRAGEVYPCRDVFPAAGSGWISAARGHDIDECPACTHMWPGSEQFDEFYGAMSEDEVADQRRWFCESYCGGGRDVDAEPCAVFFLGDVTKLKGSEILAALDVDEVDLVSGGPPCQGFSKANSKAEAEKRADPRNLLVFEFARLVLECNAKTMVMENVPQVATMLTAEGVPVIDALCRILEDGGMGTYDALRKSLLGSAGVDVGAVMRHSRRSAKPASEREAEPDPFEQEALFA